MVNIKIAIPNLETQEIANTKIDTYISKIVSNNSQNKTLTQLRDTLLPKLISGEVRLKEFKEKITAVL